MTDKSFIIFHVEKRFNLVYLRQLYFDGLIQHAFYMTPVEQLKYIYNQEDEYMSIPDGYAWDIRYFIRNYFNTDWPLIVIFGSYKIYQNYMEQERK